MSHAAIAAEALSKRYRIGAVQRHHRSLREAINDAAAAPLRRFQARRASSARSETLWALRDVSFQVQLGEVIGVIGRNGAGKSTLLKVLSRITEPTVGRVAIKGRVAALLEVGTGFHPELTGRENLFLNGAVLGMRRREIERSFDEIVSFAGVERFVDTPVKRYSSGMYLRLAFAVAAHLNPEILVVDEVLAVGDAEFQRKCLRKMNDVAHSGRTVLFVSHNLAAIRSLCARALLLHQGQLVCDDSVDRCLRTYVSGGEFHAGNSWDNPDRNPRAPLSIRRVYTSLNGHQPDHVLHVAVDLDSVGRHNPAFIALEILDAGGTAVMQPLPTIEGFMADAQRHHSVNMSVALPPLIPGQYLITVWVGSHNTETLDQVKECVGFEILESPTRGRTYPHTPDHGYIVPPTSMEYSCR